MQLNTFHETQMAVTQRPRSGLAGSNMCGGRDCARLLDMLMQLCGYASSLGQFRGSLHTNYEIGKWNLRKPP